MITIMFDATHKAFSKTQGVKKLPLLIYQHLEFVFHFVTQSDILILSTFVPRIVAGVMKIKSNLKRKKL